MVFSLEKDFPLDVMILCSMYFEINSIMTVVKLTGVDKQMAVVKKEIGQK